MSTAEKFKSLFAALIIIGFLFIIVQTLKGLFQWKINL